MCLLKRRDKMVYRNALFYGAFRRGCTVIPQTGVGQKPKENVLLASSKDGAFIVGKDSSWI